MFPTKLETPRSGDLFISMPLLRSLHLKSSVKKITPNRVAQGTQNCFR